MVRRPIRRRRAALKAARMGTQRDVRPGSPGNFLETWASSTSSGLYRCRIMRHDGSPEYNTNRELLAPGDVVCHPKDDRARGTIISIDPEGGPVVIMWSRRPFDDNA